MAIQKIHESFLYARNAGADLSGSLNLFAKVDADGDIVLATNRNDAALGVIVEAAIENKPVTVQFGCIGKVIAGEAIAAGERVCPGAAGKAYDADTTNDVAIGIALTAADAGDVFPFAFIGGGHII